MQERKNNQYANFKFEPNSGYQIMEITSQQTKNPNN